MLRIIFLLFLLTGCQTASHYTHTIDITKEDFSDADVWAMGRACAIYVGPFGPFSSNGIHEAAIKGKISRVRSVENSFGTIILFSWECTKVHGDLSDVGKIKAAEKHKRKEDAKKNPWYFSKPGEEID